MGAFVGVHGFQIHHVADDVVFFGDAVAAVHVSCHAGNVEGLAAVVALHQGDGGSGDGAALEAPTQRQSAMQAQCDFGLHVGQFFLH